MAMPKRDENTLTVEQVIALLSQMDRDRKVWAEGCDCTNPVKGVVLQDGVVVLDVEI